MSILEVLGVQLRNWDNTKHRPPKWTFPLRCTFYWPKQVHKYVYVFEATTLTTLKLWVKLLPNGN